MACTRGNDNKMATSLEAMDEEEEDPTSTVIVSNALAELWEQQSQRANSVVAKTCQILTTLLHNAATADDDSKRVVKLSNPKVQQYVVQVPGALDVLGLAGFEITECANNSADIQSTTELCLVFREQPAARSVIQALCCGLQQKRAELLAETTTAINASSSSAAAAESSSSFLSPAERRERAIRAKAARKAKQAQRQATVEQWHEDSLTRKERQITTKKKKVSLGDQRSPAPLGVIIRTLVTAHHNHSQQPTDQHVEAAGTTANLQQQHEMTDHATDAITDDTPMEMDDAIGQNANDWSWQSVLDNIPRCAAAAGVRDTSCYYNAQKHHTTTAATATLTKSCWKRLWGELQGLEESLPCHADASIWLRFDQESPQFIRVAMTAPLPGPSPYAGGVFLFDMYVPPNYPNGPPKVTLRTTGGGTVRFGPNLYDTGKVCLSLLGTWAGPGWDPQTSTIHQVLVSLQGLVLSVEHPFFLEPGHGGWEGQIQQGQFQTTGYTLRGDTVPLEQGLPPQAILYEDKIRCGTAKFALLEHLQGLLGEEEETSDKSCHSLWQSCGLAAPMHAHFYHNRAAIGTEVRRWLSDAACGRLGLASNRTVAKHQLDQLVPQMEEYLARLGPPDLTGAGETSTSNEEILQGAPVMNVRSAKAPPAAPKDDRDYESDDDDYGDEEEMDDKPSKQPADMPTMDPFAARRQKMQQAANQGDYIMAGMLQEELQRLEALQKRMEEAATKKDFIRAGHLQAEFLALAAVDHDAHSIQPMNGPAKVSSFPSVPAAATLKDDDESMDDDGDDAMGGDDNLFSMPNMAGMPPIAAAPSHAPPVGLGNNVFAPPGRKDHATPSHHAWGTGNQLSGSTDAPAASLKAAPPAAVAKNPIPKDQLCRLRIRLPNNQSLVEDFDKKDSLSAVYRRLAPHMPEEAESAAGATIDPRLYGMGAFSQPLSSAGFTLLLTRPKREFGLEMHGTKSLAELNLAPTATLTVMKCSDRGVMHRGELESRLRQAQGDALDVEGLTYEGLVELTERVGAAAPSNGEAFVSITQDELDGNSETLSPAAFLAGLESAGMEGDDGDDETERRCPVCLGSYDGTDETASLRKLSKCGHMFHSACLATWLRTKSSCPICKTSISSSPN